MTYRLRVNTQIRVPVKGEIDQMQLYFFDFSEMKSKLTKNMSKN